MFTTNIWIGILLHLSIRICNTGSTLFSTSLSLVLFQYYIFAVFNIKALVYALAKQFHFSPLFAKCMFNIRTTCIKSIYQSFFFCNSTLVLHFARKERTIMATMLKSWQIGLGDVCYTSWPMELFMLDTAGQLLMFGEVFLEKTGELGEFCLKRWLTW